MRRTLATTTLIALTLAACGSDSDSSEAPVSIAAADAEDSEADGDADSTDEDSSTDDAAGGGDVAPAQTVCPPDAASEPTPKPEVDIPGEVGDELVTTVLTEGTGAEAVDGDTVVVDYVGVRSVDGEEFDNSYERGEPFPVTLGSGSVIQGWEAGLVGAQTGARLQLDIPPALAYGENARSEVIRENEPLTFVIDVRAVIPVGNPSEAPSEPGVELSTGEGVDDTVFEDLAEGDGATLECGDTAVIRYVNFRGDNGVAIESNWGADPLQIPFGDNLLPGLLEGMEGMKVGGQRAITVPPEDGFGPEGNPQGGLPANTDMIFVIELIGTY